MTGTQLALDCEPDWPTPAEQPARRPLPHPNVFDRYDLRTQGLTKAQIRRMKTVRVQGDYL